MNNILYISNIEVPYRNEFFNQISENVNLTVLYDRKKTSNRDEKWAKSVKPRYEVEYLSGINVNNEYTFDLKIIKYIFSKKYKKIIIGCCNSPSQMLAIILMKIFRKEYILNLDGEYFLDGNTLKKIIKRFFVKGAQQYLIAGEKCAENLSKYIPKEKIFPYYFSSLTKKEVKNNSNNINKNINNKILVVGQYLDYKGLDIALECAKYNQLIQYRFIGSGKNSKALKDKVNDLKLNNVEVIPFLEKDKLYKEYQECFCMLLPSKQECWGLVINEAASFGTPIISTSGSGAAIEFLSDKYNEFIAESGSKKDLYEKILNLLKYDRINEYKEYLIEKSKKYTIEKSVEDTLVVLGK